VRFTRIIAGLCGALLIAVASGAMATHCAPPQPADANPKPARIIAPGMKIGVALGSGSMHGIAHIGVIQELEARGLDVRVVAGTSVGALVGALWASGLTGREIEALSRESDWEDVGQFALSWQGLFSSNPLKEQLEKVFAGRPIESWPRRFGAVATNVDNGHRVIIRRGNGALAVQASSAVPVLFKPVTIDGLRLGDGALVEPVPIDAARVLGADFVIGIDVAYRPYEESASGMTQFAFQAMHILINSLGQAQLRSADVVIRMDVHHKLMECGSEGVIAAGREAVRLAWPELARSIEMHAARRETP
jgi:NTE family protein